jgi:hypothetical protein
MLQSAAHRHGLPEVAAEDVVYKEPYRSIPVINTSFLLWFLEESSYDYNDDGTLFVAFNLCCIILRSHDSSLVK